MIQIDVVKQIRKPAANPTTTAKRRGHVGVYVNGKWVDDSVFTTVKVLEAAGVEYRVTGWQLYARNPQKFSGSFDFNAFELGTEIQGWDGRS